MKYSEREKNTARCFIKRLVGQGKIPRPNTLRCADCNKRADEYDHYLGYARKHRGDVQPICFSCHKRRNWNRGEYKTTPRMIAIREKAVRSITRTCPHGTRPTHKCKYCRLERGRRWRSRNREQSRKDARARYRRQKRGGLCTKCSHRAIAGQVFCGGHASANKTKASAYYARRSILAR